MNLFNNLFYIPLNYVTNIEYTKCTNFFVELNAFVPVIMCVVCRAMFCYFISIKSMNAGNRSVHLLSSYCLFR